MSEVNEEWIAQSLARLEEAEQAREQHEAALETATDADALREHSEAIEALDQEIRNLYTALEAVAGDEGDGAADESVSEQVSTSEFQPEPEPAPAPAAAAPEPAPAAASADLDDYDPFGAPAPAAAPVAAAADAPAASFGEDFGGSAGSYDDFDESSGGGAMKWVVLLVLLIGGGGVGGYLYMKQNQEAPPPQAPAGEAQVISSNPVPPDTQGPKVAKGGEADVAHGTKIRETARRPGGGGGGGGGGKPRPKSKKKGKGIQIENSNDPLAGLN